MTLALSMCLVFASFCIFQLEVLGLAHSRSSVMFVNWWFDVSLFIYFFGHTRGIWKFLGPGLNPSGSCNLRCSCRNAGSNHCSRPGTKPTPLQQPEWLQLDSYLTHCATAGTPSLYTFDESPLLEVFYQYPLPAWNLSLFLLCIFHRANILKF